MLEPYAQDEQGFSLAGMIDSTPSCLKVITREGLLLKMNPRGLSLIEADDFASVDGANVYELVEDVCAGLSIPSLNLLPAFLGEEPSDLWINRMNAHPNAYANGLAAPVIEEFLVRAAIVPDPGQAP